MHREHWESVYISAGLLGCKLGISFEKTKPQISFPDHLYPMNWNTYIGLTFAGLLLPLHPGGLKTNINYIILFG
jgi:hypothetical protein